MRAYADLRRTLLAGLLLGVGCSPTLSEYEPRTGVIRGTVLYPGGVQRGNAIILLFREDQPPPPEGSGSPVNFVVVPSESLFGGEASGVAKDFSAEFTIPTVAPGRYTIRGFLDADLDFNPVYGLLAQPTAGDVGGGYVDSTTQTLRTLEVKADEVSQNSILVVLGQVIPVERPAFAITSSTTFEVPFSRPAAFAIESHPIIREQVRLAPERTKFLVQFADLDHDGAPDDANRDHLPDLLPRVLLKKKAAPGDRGAVIVPLIIDPRPYQDALAARGSTLTARLDLIVPPVAVELAGGAQTVLESIPAGDYSTVVISGTGQTWEVPNDLDQIQPTGVDPTQSQWVHMVEGPPPPRGRIRGTLHVNSDAVADGFVLVFEDRPISVLGGLPAPVAAVTVAKERFVAAGGGREAGFSVAGLPAGRYVVRGLYDVDGDFSLLSPWAAQPSAGDWLGAAAEAVTIAEDEAEGVVVSAGQMAPLERPAFELEGGPVRLLRSHAPQVIELRAHPIAALGMAEDRTRFPVTRATQDQIPDNLPDLTPWVVMTRLVDVGDPRVAPPHPSGTRIVGVVDPLPFLGSLGAGNPLVPTDRLRVIVPPFAVVPGAEGALAQVSPIPSGRYRLTVISPFLASWSVPSSLDFALARVGTPLEDATQAAVLEIAANAVPAGEIRGRVTLQVTPPTGELDVVVLAFPKASPPPPHGFGRPVASAVVRKADFSGGASAPYALTGLATGTYQIRAFLDADHNFVPWFDTHNQPTAGDVGGGALSGGALTDVSVNDLSGPTVDVGVEIVPGLTYVVDRPVFAVEGGAISLSLGVGPVAAALATLAPTSNVLTTRGVFQVRWVDLNQDGNADDVTFDGQPDVFPLVVAQLLDPNDPTHLTPAPGATVIFGVVNPAQFNALGFAGSDPTAVTSTAVASRLDVVFPPVAIDLSARRPVNPAPQGHYRLTVINARGQTWTVPNDLERAVGDPLAVSQAVTLSVVP